MLAVAERRRWSSGRTEAGAESGCHQIVRKRVYSSLSNKLYNTAASARRAGFYRRAFGDRWAGRSRQPSEFWAALLEKAYAKYEKQNYIRTL
jgi:outer membrane protein assembly factor BamD (BamD/ComL family)